MHRACITWCEFNSVFCTADPFQVAVLQWPALIQQINKLLIPSLDQYFESSFVFENAAVLVLVKDINFFISQPVWYGNFHLVVNLQDFKNFLSSPVGFAIFTCMVSVFNRNLDTIIWLFSLDANLSMVIWFDGLFQKSGDKNWKCLCDETSSIRQVGIIQLIVLWSLRLPIIILLPDLDFITDSSTVAGIALLLPPFGWQLLCISPYRHPATQKVCLQVLLDYL